jgi:carbon storage regulator CsrA
MLILTRKEGESVTVRLPDGKEMRMYVTAIKSNSIRLAFDAPKEITFHRYDEEQELEKNLLEIKKEKNIKCFDNEFIRTWMEAPIPELGMSAREAVRKEPKRVSQVWLLLKKEFENERIEF